MILFDTDALKKKLLELEKKTNEEGFWEDSVKSTNILQEIKNIKYKIDSFEQLAQTFEDIEVLTTMGLDEKDESVIPEVKSSYKNLIKNIDKLEIEILLNGKYDKNNAIISLHPGAGGTESQDWAEMLYRMYTRWASKNGFDIKEIDYQAGDEAGIKSVTAIISRYKCIRIFKV